MAGGEAGSGLVPWHEDFVFEGVKASEQVTVTCFLHRRSLASASGATGVDALGESAGWIDGWRYCIYYIQDTKR